MPTGAFRACALRGRISGGVKVGPSGPRYLLGCLIARTQFLAFAGHCAGSRVFGPRAVLVEPAGRRLGQERLVSPSQEEARGRSTTGRDVAVLSES